jgi:hypothetical protein
MDLGFSLDRSNSIKRVGGGSFQRNAQLAELALLSNQLTGGDVQSVSSKSNKV